MVWALLAVFGVWQAAWFSAFNREPLFVWGAVLWSRRPDRTRVWQRDSLPSLEHRG